MGVDWNVEGNTRHAEELVRQRVVRLRTFINLHAVALLLLRWWRINCCCLCKKGKGVERGQGM